MNHWTFQFWLDWISINLCTLQAVNEGITLAPTTRHPPLPTLPVAGYEDMGPGYTTSVHALYGGSVAQYGDADTYNLGRDNSDNGSIFTDSATFSRHPRTSDLAGQSGGMRGRHGTVSDTYERGAVTYNLARDNSDNISIYADSSSVSRQIGPRDPAGQSDVLYVEQHDVQVRKGGFRLSRHYTPSMDIFSPIFEDDSLDLETPSLTEFSEQDILCPDLTIHNNVRQCGFSFFCDATLKHRGREVDVTVKVLSEFASKRKREVFMEEIESVRGLGQHANFAEVVALCCDSNPNCIIFARISELTLKQSILKEAGTIDQTNPKREVLRRYSVQISRGMVFLTKNGFCHPRLRSERINVDNMNVCKLYDVTPVKLCHSDSDIYKDGSAGRLMAPEILKGEVHSNRTDVWSFGNLLWEIQYYGFNSPTIDAGAVQVFSQLMGPGHPGKPTYCSDQTYELMLKCWEEDPVTRPTFDEIQEELESMEATETTLPEHELDTQDVAGSPSDNL